MTDTSSNPQVTVLMPVYNAEPYVAKALESILNQTLKDFEFLIIDDGSTDQSARIIQSYDDPRIRFYANEQNLGLIRTLNKGLELAQGEYIARMDADDISLPQRLKRQVEYMDSHPEIGICGAWVETFGSSSVIVRYPSTPEDVRVHLLFSNALAHPAVLLRRQLFVKHDLQFDENYTYAEDFQLWQRASEYFPIVNIDDVLLKYNVHAQSVSGSKAQEQAEAARRINQTALLALGINASEADLNLHHCLAAGGERLRIIPLDEAEHWLTTILTANDSKQHYPQEALRRLCGDLWVKACRAHKESIDWHYIASPLTRNITMTKRLKFQIHCLFSRFKKASQLE